MRTISHEAAEQDFVKLIDEVEQGESFMITRNGKDIARLEPLVSGPRLKKFSPEWEKARQELRDIMEKGYDLGGLRIDRDALYDR